MKFLKNYSMMLVKSIAVLMFMSLIFSSCKKATVDYIDAPAPPPAPTIAGKWYGILSGAGSLEDTLTVNIKAAGLLETLDKAGIKNGEGTWTLNGSTFKANYSIGSPVPAIRSLIGTLENPGRLSGAWGNGNSQTNGGFWHWDKQP